MTDSDISSNRADPLSVYRNYFVNPMGKTQIAKTYLCGHSLGLQPVNAKKELDQILINWASNGVRAHFEGPEPWIHYTKQIESQMSRLIGAGNDEVCLMNGLSVNLHLLLHSFYFPEKKRTKIILEDPCFPSDRYIINSHLISRGYDPQNEMIFWQRNGQTNQFEMEDLINILHIHGEETALILLGGVNYQNGALLDIPEITRVGHQYDCMVGFDLAHATGNVPLKLKDWNVDFAAWCTYKYLNGGPGSLGGIFIHRKHWAKGFPRLEGWWGNTIENRFDMRPDFQPATGAAAWQLSNPPIMALAPLKAAMQIFMLAGMEAIREKSVRLTKYLEDQLLNIDTDHLSITTPNHTHQRGAMLTFSLGAQTYNVYKYLLDRQVVVDFRKPDIIRIAPAPLYNGFEDVANFIRILKESLYIKRLN